MTDHSPFGRSPRRLLPMLLAAVLLAAPAAHADDDDHDRAREALRRGEVMPLIRILGIAEKQLPGEVLAVELETKKGRLVYELKILNKRGKVQELLLDARDGGFIRLKDD